jgi:hypothetical protein
MRSTVILPQPGQFQRGDVYMRKIWRRLQYLANLFWTRWRKEYLATLQERQQRNKPMINLQVDDVVLLKDDQLPRNSWSMSRIIKTEPHNAGLVHSVVVKTAKSEYQKTC